MPARGSTPPFTAQGGSRARGFRGRSAARVAAGFTLIEAAVALAVVAILAGLMAPLAVQAIRRQREYRTRELLQQAFEAAFGARDRRVANCRADFGFDPYPVSMDLRILTTTVGTNWVGTLPYANTYGFLSGWNGPYWQGPSDSLGRPLDGWGRPLVLQSTTSTWQMRSVGPDGVQGNGDDLVYPSTPAPYVSYNATLILNVTRASTDITGFATVNWVYGTSPASFTRCWPYLSTAPTVGNLASLSLAIQNVPNPAAMSWNVPAGVLRLYVYPNGTGSFGAVTRVLDLLPGETRQLSLTL